MLIHRIHLAAITLFIGACQSNPTQIEPVVVRVAGANIGAPVNTYLITQASMDGGVLVSTTAGDGRREFSLAPLEAMDVIDRMDAEFKEWRKTAKGPPVQRVVAVEVSGQPYSIELIRREGMSEPVFRIIIGYRDVAASAVLDKTNAQNWINNMKALLAYQ